MNNLYEINKAFYINNDKEFTSVTNLFTIISEITIYHFPLLRACCLKDKYSPGEWRLYQKHKVDVTIMINS